MQSRWRSPGAKSVMLMLRWPITVGAIVLVVGSCFAPESSAATALVQMDVAIGPGLDANRAAQQWTTVLTELGISNVHFRRLQNGDQITVKTSGSGDATIHQVTAQLNNRGALVTPGGQFTFSDAAKLKKWLDGLQDGSGLPGQRKAVFGLTSKQLEEVKRSLSAPVGFATKGLRPEKVVEQIRSGLTVPLVVAAQLGQ